MKNKLIRTIPEKYGHHDVYYEAINMINVNKKLDPEKLFDLVPYVDILYIPFTHEFDEWWHDSNEDTLIKSKILRVNDTTVDLIHYDSHNNILVFRRPEFNGFMVEGNKLIN